MGSPFGKGGQGDFIAGCNLDHQHNIFRLSRDKRGFI